MSAQSLPGLAGLEHENSHAFSITMCCNAFVFAFGVAAAPCFVETRRQFDADTCWCHPKHSHGDAVQVHDISKTTTNVQQSHLRCCLATNVRKSFLQVCIDLCMGACIQQTLLCKHIIIRLLHN